MRQVQASTLACTDVFWIAALLSLSIEAGRVRGDACPRLEGMPQPRELAVRDRSGTSDQNPLRQCSLLLCMADLAGAMASFSEREKPVRPCSISVHTGA